MPGPMINEFRISIAIEDEVTDGMLLLVAPEVPPNGMRLRTDDAPTGPSRELLPVGLEGSFSCTKATWLRLKTEAERQGATWTKGTTKLKSTYWTSKPKVTVIHVSHCGLLNGEDRSFAMSGARLIGTVDDRIIKIILRDKLATRPIQGL